MKMEYLTRNQEPLNFGTRLGIAGLLHAMENGDHVGDAQFELVVDQGVDGWVVLLLVHPQDLNGMPLGGHTAVAMGQASKQPFKDFDAAQIFCRAVGLQLYGREVAEGYITSLINSRGLSAVQWRTDPEGEVVPVKAADPDDEELDDNDGSDCDLRVEVPATRTLH